MFKSIGSTLIIIALGATSVAAQTQNTTSQDRQAQEQVERDKKQAKRDQKEKDKANKKEPGSRCARWKAGKA
jgi:Ni/Co efflux regulator RcnB